MAKYHKPIDIPQYLHFESHTPKNCKKKSIPYTRIIYTIITDKNLKKHLKELHTTLHQRGFPTTPMNKEKYDKENYGTRKSTITKKPLHS